MCEVEMALPRCDPSSDEKIAGGGVSFVLPYAVLVVWEMDDEGTSNELLKKWHQQQRGDKR